MVFWVAFLSVLQASACPSHLILRPEDPSRVLNQAILSSICADFVADLSKTDSAIVELSTIGQLATLEVHCNRGNLTIPQTITVPEGSFLLLSGCFLHVNSLKTAIEVFGSANLEDCVLEGTTGKGIYVQGELNVRNSTFKNNENTLFWADLVGFRLMINKCVFAGNRADIGTIVAVDFIGIKAGFGTFLSIENCLFTNNSANIMGSVLSFSSDYLQTLSSTRISAPPTLLFRNNTVAFSAEYALFLSISHTNASFLSCHFEEIGCIFLLRIADSSVNMRDITVKGVGRVVLATHIAGAITAKSIYIDTSTNGPCFLFINDLFSPDAQITLSDISIRNPTMTNLPLYTSTIYTLLVQINIENVYIEGGYTFAAACGAFLFSYATVRNCTFRKGSCTQGGLIGHVYASGLAWDLSQIDVVTEKMGGLIVLTGTIDYRNLSFIAANPACEIQGAPLVFYDATVTVTNVYIDALGIQTTNVIYAWNCNISLSSLVFTRLITHHFIDIGNSQAYVAGVVAESLWVDILVMLTAGSYAEVRDIEIVGGRMTTGLVGMRDRSRVLVENVSLVGGHYNSIANGDYTDGYFRNITVQDSAMETLFVLLLNR